MEHCIEEKSPEYFWEASLKSEVNRMRQNKNELRISILFVFKHCFMLPVILPTTCFTQFLCSSRLASTFGKSLSAVFVASSNSGRDVESVITAISHFSLWSKTLHCWQKLSKSTNQRVYQDLVYRNELLLKILTSVPAPLSPVPVYFSSLSLLRTALHHLNAWNRLRANGRNIVG